MSRDYALLRRAAERARTHPFFLAAVLLDWAEREQMDDAALAAWLGCALEDLPRVLLCRRPRGTGPQFREDVTRIAERFRVDPQRLAQAIRYADAQAATAATAFEEWLAAARDREATDESAEGPQP